MSYSILMNELLIQGLHESYNTVIICPICLENIDPFVTILPQNQSFSDDSINENEFIDIELTSRGNSRKNSLDIWSCDNCSNLVHNECILKWSGGQSFSCPICRKNHELNPIVVKEEEKKLIEACDVIRSCGMCVMISLICGFIFFISWCVIHNE